MSVLAGTQLDLLSCLGASNGIAQVEDQEPIADYIWFVSQDADITPELYQYCENLFTKNLLIGDLETYGMEMPENGAYKKKTTNAQSYKKGKTNGLQDLALSPIYGDIRLLQLAGLDSEKIPVVDFKTKWDRPQLSIKYVEFLDWLIEKIRQFAKRKGILIGHNIGFDLGFLRAKYGIKFWKAYDTMIMSQLLSAGILTHKHGLKDCCNRYLGIDVDKTEQSADNSLPLRNAQINYAASDIINTGELFLILKNEIRIAGLEVVTEIEAEFTPALVEINYWGMPVDLMELDRQIKWYFTKLLSIETEFVEMFPFMNIRSSKHIAGIVEDINKSVLRAKKTDVDSLVDDEETENYKDKLRAKQFAQLEVLAEASQEDVKAGIEDTKVMYAEIEVIIEELNKYYGENIVENGGKEPGVVVIMFDKEGNQTKSRDKCHSESTAWYLPKYFKNKYFRINHPGIWENGFTKIRNDFFHFKNIEIEKAGSSKSDLALLNDHRVVQLVVDFRTVSIYLNYCQQVKQEIVWIEGVPRVSGSIRQLTRKGQGRTCSGNKKAPVKCQGSNLQNPPSQKSINKRLKASGCPTVREIFRAKQIKLKPKLELHLIAQQELHALVWLMDFRIVDVDLPAAHLAIATYMSGETAIEDCARDKIDLHAITMHSVFGSVDKYDQYRHLNIKEITKINKTKTELLHKEFDNIRSCAKCVVYGGLNNQSAPTLQNTIKVMQGEEVELDICEAMVNAFPNIFPRIAELRETLWKRANNNKICVDGHWYGTFQDDYGTFSTPGYRRRVYSFCKTSFDGKNKYVPKGDIANCWLNTEASSVKSGISSIYQNGVFTERFELRLSSICHDEVVLFCRKYQDLEVAILTQDSMRKGLEKFTGNGKIPYPDMMKNPRKLISDGWEH